MMQNLFSARVRKAFAGLVLLSVLAAPVSPILTVQTASATWTVTDPAHTIQGTITAAMSTISSAALKSLGLKEWTLDGVLFALAKKALQQMVKSTVAWINSGFKGSPMFISNPGQFLMGIADETAGEIIYGSDLNFLCSPMNIRLALEFYYKQGKRKAPQCTLSGIVKNVEGFFNGNFMAGGWTGWMAISLTPTNQPIGGFMAARSSLDSEVARRVGVERDLLSWANGFLSYKQCTDPKDPKTCKIVTPGSVIKDALSFNVTVGERVLIEADEINEIVGALFAQLGSMALSSLGGVSGLSQSGSGYQFGSGGSNIGNGSYVSPTYCNQLSYLDQLDDPRCNPNLGAVFSTSTATSTAGESSFLAEALAGERQYAALHTSVINAANSVIDEASARGLSCRENTRVADAALGVRNTAAIEVADADRMIARLLDIDNDYKYGSGVTQVDAVNEFLEIEGSGELHTTVTNVREEQRVADIKTGLERLRRDIENCSNDANDTPSPSASNGQPLDWPLGYWSDTDTDMPLATARVSEVLIGGLKLAESAPLTQALHTDKCTTPRASKFPDANPRRGTFSSAVAHLKSVAAQGGNERSYIYVEVPGSSGALHFIEEGEANLVCFMNIDVTEAMKLNPTRIVRIHTHPFSKATPPSPLDMLSEYRLPKVSGLEYAVVDSGNLWVYSSSAQYVTSALDYASKLQSLGTVRAFNDALDADLRQKPLTEPNLLASVAAVTTRAANGEFGSSAESKAKSLRTNTLYKILEYTPKIFDAGLSDSEMSGLLSLHRDLGGTITRTRL